LESRRQVKELQEKLEQTEREMGEIRPDCTCGINIEWRIFRFFICGSKRSKRSKQKSKRQ